MKVLSINDGAGALNLALNLEKIDVEAYAFTERDPSLVKCSLYNHPKSINMGFTPDLIRADGTKTCDLLVLFDAVPMANKKKSILQNSPYADFWTFLDLKEKLKPRFFLTVCKTCSDSDLMILHEKLGTSPMYSNVRVLSPITQDMVYFTNISGGQKDLFGKPMLLQPEDTMTEPKDYLDAGCGFKGGKFAPITKNDAYDGDDIRAMVKNWKTTFNVVHMNISSYIGDIRTLNQNEMERICGYPEGYTKYVSKLDAIPAFSSSYNVGVLRYIVSQMKRELKDMEE